MNVRHAGVAVLAGAALVASCSGQGNDVPPSDGEGAGTQPASTATDEPPTVGAERPTTGPTGPATATYQPPPAFDAEQAMATVTHLAGEIGPREATSPAFHEAADWVAEQFAGPRSSVGAPLARAVHAAVAAGTVAWTRQVE